MLEREKHQFLFYSQVASKNANVIQIFKIVLDPTQNWWFYLLQDQKLTRKSNFVNHYPINNWHFAMHIDFVLDVIASLPSFYDAGEIYFQAKKKFNFQLHSHVDLLCSEP